MNEKCIHPIDNKQITPSLMKQNTIKVPKDKEFIKLWGPSVNTRNQLTSRRTVRSWVVETSTFKISENNNYTVYYKVKGCLSDCLYAL